MPLTSVVWQWTSRVQLEPAARAIPLQVSEAITKLVGLVPPIEEASVPLALPPELVTVKVWFPESPGATVPKLKVVGEMERLAEAGAGGVTTGWAGWGTHLLRLLAFPFRRDRALPAVLLALLGGVRDGRGDTAVGPGRQAHEQAKKQSGHQQQLRDPRSWDRARVHARSTRV